MNNKTRHIGQDKTRLASVGIGAMSFSNFYGPCNDEQADSILTAAIELGLNHIDTSNVYGMGVSEQRIGSFGLVWPGRNEPKAALSPFPCLHNVVVVRRCWAQECSPPPGGRLYCGPS